MEKHDQGSSFQLPVEEAGAGPVVTRSNESAVSWGAIVGGAVAAAGLSLILLFTGTGLGLSMASPWSHSGANSGAIGVAAILWLGLTQVLASWLGGYLAGRLRKKWIRIHDHEVTFRDTAHGLITWALASVVTALVFSSVIGSITSSTVQAAGSAAGTVTSSVAAASAASGSDNSSPVDYFADSLFRSGQAGATSTGAKPLDPNERAEVVRIFGHAIRQGDLSSEDTTYLGQVVAQHTGLPPAQAQQRVTAVFASLQQQLRALETKAKEAADKARKDAAYTALWLAIALLIGAFTASFSATYGGRTRDSY